ncbi:MAG: methyl-accepting chemotaxis protein, partial [Spirochaetota bacterium]|nr:methyl-accepting chemotaxis protein [Spirochaetota bacterium]
MKGLSQKNTLNIFSNLHRSAHSFELASKELTVTAKSMMDFAGEINKKSNGFKTSFSEINSDFLTISSAVEEFTINMKSISDNATQSINNIDIISTATSELSNAATEIAQNTGSAKAYSNDSLEVLKEASENFEKLKNASKEIDIVTQTITSIADQTNLLALNATIEAARAGSAGKGFAVVASEVKELAKQSKDATEEITDKVNVIQSGINVTVSSMEMISKVIHKMNDLVDNIAAATEEQSVT